jgi:hypothetical protein
MLARTERSVNGLIAPIANQVYSASTRIDVPVVVVSRIKVQPIDTPLIARVDLCVNGVLLRRCSAWLCDDGAIVVEPPFVKSSRRDRMRYQGAIDWPAEWDVAIVEAVKKALRSGRACR